MIWAELTHGSLAWGIVEVELVLLLLAVFRAVDWRPRVGVPPTRALFLSLRYTIARPLIRSITALAFAWLGGPIQTTGLIALVAYALAVAETLFVRQPKALAIWRIKSGIRLPVDAPLAEWWDTSWALAAVTAMWAISPTFEKSLLLGVVAGLIVGTKSKYERICPDSFVAAGTVLIFSLVLAIVTFQIVWPAGPSSAVYAQLITILAALAIIPLTIAVAGSQVIVSFVGSQSASALPLQWTRRTFLAAVLCLGADLWLFGQNTGFRRVELAELSALLVTTAVLLSIGQLVLALRPEGIVSHLIGKLNEAWFKDAVLATYQPYWGTQGVSPDPFSPVERILYKAATAEGDDLLFASTLELLWRRIRQFVTKPEGFVLAGGHTVDSIRAAEAADSYSVNRLRGVVEHAARSRSPWVLERLGEFAGAITEESYGSNLGGTSDHSVPGLRVIQALSEAGLAADLPEIVDDALLRAGLFMESTIAHLPVTTGVPQVAPGTQFDNNSPGMGYLDGFENFLSWVENVAARARRTSDPTVLVRRAGAALGFLFGAIIVDAADADWADHLLFLVARSQREVAEQAEAWGDSAFGPIAVRRGGFVFAPGSQRDRRVAARAAREVAFALSRMGRTYDPLLNGTSIEGLVSAMAAHYPRDAAAIAAQLYRADRSWVSRQSGPVRNPGEADQRLGRVRLSAGPSVAEFNVALAEELQTTPWFVRLRRYLGFRGFSRS